MELNGAKRMFEDDQEDDDEEFDPSKHEYHEFTYLPLAPDILYSAEAIPPRITKRKVKEKGKEVEPGSQDPPAPRTTTPPPHQASEEAARPIKEPVPVPPSSTRPPHVGDAFTQKTDEESSDITTPESSRKSSPAPLPSDVPRTNVILPSSPSRHPSSPPTEAIRFANIGTPLDSNMDVDEAGTSTEDLQDALGRLKAACKLSIPSFISYLSLHLQRLQMTVMCCLKHTLLVLVSTVTFYCVILSNVWIL